MRTLSHANNTYLLEIDGEVFETYIPSPEQDAARVLEETYGGSIQETQRSYAQGQRMDLIEDKQYRWGEPKTT